MGLSIRSTRSLDKPNEPDRVIASAEYLPLFAVGVAPDVGHDYRGERRDFTLPIQLYASSGSIQNRAPCLGRLLSANRMVVDVC